MKLSLVFWFKKDNNQYKKCFFKMKKKYIRCSNNCCKLFTTDTVIKESEEYVLDTKKHTKSGILLIDSKNRILLSQSYNTFWGIPKGTQEPGETVIEAAIRETKEETGISLQKSIFENSKTRILIIKKNFYHIFIVKLNTEGISTVSDPSKLLSESTGCGWININCLKDLSQKKIIKINFLTKSILTIKH